MSMYALLRSSAGRPTRAEIEEAVGGNLCRCTGYRPILAGFARFAEGAPPPPTPTKPSGAERRPPRWAAADAPADAARGAATDATDATDATPSPARRRVRSRRARRRGSVRVRLRAEVPPPVARFAAPSPTSARPRASRSSPRTQTPRRARTLPPRRERHLAPPDDPRAPSRVEEDPTRGETRVRKHRSRRGGQVQTRALSNAHRPDARPRTHHLRGGRGDARRVRSSGRGDDVIDAGATMSRPRVDARPESRRDASRDEGTTSLVRGAAGTPRRDRGWKRVHGVADIGFKPHLVGVRRDVRVRESRRGRATRRREDFFWDIADATRARRKFYARSRRR